MKKCVSICKLHTILEVAPSKKIRCLREKTLSIQARFSVKNRAKIGAESDSKWQRQEKPTKTGSGAVSGRTFSSPDSKKSQNRGLRLPKILLKTLQDGPFWGGSQNGRSILGWVSKNGRRRVASRRLFWGGLQKMEGVGWPRDASKRHFRLSPPSPFHDHGRRQRRRTCDFGGSFHRGDKGRGKPL